MKILTNEKLIEVLLSEGLSNAIVETSNLMSIINVIISTKRETIRPEKKTPERIAEAESDATYTDEDLEKIQQLFVSAARDCVPQDRNSFVTFQANTGVEVCTFRLVVKNAASLLGDKDPVKLKAEALLDNLIRYPISSTCVVAFCTNLCPSNSQILLKGGI
uniref:Uncharacterized protein n=1 Tax=Cajanus cajan TaxID=3821 RepID=A0A151TC18_CAJCA|nr:hypothetical protein KK1_019189 [Cajanus cajan]